MVFTQKYTLSAALIAAIVMINYIEAKSITPSSNEDDSVSAVIPSPNQEFGYESDIVRKVNLKQDNHNHKSNNNNNYNEDDNSELTQEAASNEAAVPVYVSPFVRSERAIVPAAPSFDPQESSHAPPNYAPRPSAASLSSASTRDLKTSASYGHHQGHHGGHYDHSGGLDMGAWTGGKGSFGWYADYPVGGKHHGYGRK